MDDMFFLRWRLFTQGLQSSNLSRLQQDLFHELKKVCHYLPYVTYAMITVCSQNGSARSLSVALEVFAALFPNTRPSRRQSLSQSLFPVLLRLLSRAEEGLHEALQESLSHILPTMTPFISAANIQVHSIYHVTGQLSHMSLGS